MMALARQSVAFLELRKRSIKLLDAVSLIYESNDLISICSYCRKIKDESGRWEYIDKFLMKNTNLMFSHGVCDQCMEQNLPDVLEVWENKKNSL